MLSGAFLRKRARGFDYLIVGAGFAGSVLAERLAATANKRILLIDRRSHIAGNAYDSYNDDGILVQRYGPHIFHTNSKQVVDYLGRFTAWRPYQHRVRAAVGDVMLPIPINRTTINGLFGLDLSEAETREFLQNRAERVARIKTSEDVVISQVGRELYEAFSAAIPENIGVSILRSSTNRLLPASRCGPMTTIAISVIPTN